MKSISWLRLSIAIALVAVVSIGGFNNEASAATPPDSCFAFNTTTGTITDYYDHESNNSANPACPRDVDTPSTIGGVAVVAIGSLAFYGNQLTTVTIPSSVTSIGNYAFYNNQLTSVTIPSSVTSIGSSAFSNNQLTSVTIPSSVTSIGDLAFSNNQLTSVTIPNAAATMQHSSFVNNPITTMIIGTTTYTAQSPTAEPACFAMSGSTVIDYYQASPLIARDNGVLCGTDVTIPNSITSIGNSAFYTNQLTTVTIPNSVTSIGFRAFSSNQLTTLTIPNSVTSIGNSAFYGNQLTTVTIPNSVTIIAYDSFIMQNQYGGSIERDNGIGPYIWSDNPAEIQAAYEEIWYVQLYTEDPSNPNNLTDGVVSESDWWGGDENEDGEDDSFGGHLINPAAAEVSYKNASGTELQASLTSVGQLPNGDRIQTYYADQGPRLFNTYNPTPEEVEATRQALTAYHRLGDEVTITPPAIDGYITPPTQTFVLGAADNEFSYIYTTPEDDEGSAEAGNDGTESGTGGELANTGMSIHTIIMFAGTLIATASLMFTKMNKRKGMTL